MRGRLEATERHYTTSFVVDQPLDGSVGVEPNIVDVPVDVLKSVTMPVFGHLFGVRHHAELSTVKADAVMRPRHDDAEASLAAQLGAHA